MNQKKKQHVGTLIRRARRLKGLSQDDLAIKLGVHRNTISSWENGRYNSPIFMQKISLISYHLDILKSFLLESLLHSEILTQEKSDNER